MRLGCVRGRGDGLRWDRSWRWVPAGDARDAGGTEGAGRRLGRGLGCVQAVGRMCSVLGANVFSFSANVFSFGPNVFSFQSNVFTSEGHVFSFRRRASPVTAPFGRLRAGSSGTPG